MSVQPRLDGGGPPTPLDYQIEKKQPLEIRWMLEMPGTAQFASPLKTRNLLLSQIRSFNPCLPLFNGRKSQYYPSGSGISFSPCSLTSNSILITTPHALILLPNLTIQLLPPGYILGPPPTCRKTENAFTLIETFLWMKINSYPKVLRLLFPQHCFATERVRPGFFFI